MATRGRVRAGPSFLLGTLSIRIANLLCMTLVKAMASGFPKALFSAAALLTELDLFIARTDRHATDRHEAKVTVPS